MCYNIRTEGGNMLVMPILNTNRNGVSKIFFVEVELKKSQKIKEGTVIKGINESDVTLNGNSFNNSSYENKSVHPNRTVNFLRDFNYQANKRDFLVSTKHYSDSDSYDLYSIPMPPRKITAGLDNLYGSVILDIKNRIPDIDQGNYLSLKQLNLDKHITTDKMDKLKYCVSIEKDKIKRNNLFQLNNVSDLSKTVDFMKLFNFTIIKNATLTETELTHLLDALKAINTSDFNKLSQIYNIAKDNKEVYSKLTNISKVIDNKPLNLIQSRSKSKVLVKTNDTNKAA